jgi:hypothetical protein
MLHYKYISLDYVITRYSELRSGLSLADRERGWGSQYLWERKAIHRNHQLITLMARIVVPASRLEDLRLRATLLPWKLMALLHLTLDVAMTPRSWLRALRLLLAKGNGCTASTRPSLRCRHGSRPQTVSDRPRPSR